MRLELVSASSLLKNGLNKLSQKGAGMKAGGRARSKLVGDVASWQHVKTAQSSNSHADWTGFVRVG
jgi:hypothetical protein